MVVLCMTFALIDMISADFVVSQTLSSTLNAAGMGISGECHFSDFGCSVYWIGPYTLQDFSCLGSYSSLCISFGGIGANCVNHKDDLYNYLFANSILSFIIMVLWEAIIFLEVWLYSVRWTDIQRKIEIWNKPENEVGFL
jgi:hypothetical protein